MTRLPLALGCTAALALAGWWSATLVVRREQRRAVMAEAKYRALLTEFSTPGDVQVPF